MSLILYTSNHAISPWPLRAWLALKVLGIPFEERVVDLLAPDKKQALAQVSPNGRVPALRDGDTVVWESTAILEYVAERFPDKAVWPADAAGRAHARSLAHEVHAGFAALRKACIFDMNRAPSAGVLDDAARADVARVVAIWTDTRARFGGAGGPFLFGAFTAADAMFAPFVHRFLSFEVAGLEGVADYMNAIKSLPAWTEWKSTL